MRSLDHQGPAAPQCRADSRRQPSARPSRCSPPASPTQYLAALRAAAFRPKHYSDSPAASRASCLSVNSYRTIFPSRTVKMQPTFASTSAPLARPRARIQLNTTTDFPASTIRSTPTVDSSKESRKRTQARSASGPMAYVSGSGSQAVLNTTSQWSSYSSLPPSHSFRSQCSKTWRTISTFSSDIAHAVSRHGAPGSMQTAAIHPKRLLRQPSGFEGFFPFGEGIPPADLPSLEPVRREDPHLDLGTAPTPSPAQSLG